MLPDRSRPVSVRRELAEGCPSFRGRKRRLSAGSARTGWVFVPQGEGDCGRAVKRLRRGDGPKPARPARAAPASPQGIVPVSSSAARSRQHQPGDAVMGVGLDVQGTLTWKACVSVGWRVRCSRSPAASNVRPPSSRSAPAAHDSPAAISTHGQHARRGEGDGFVDTEDAAQHVAGVDVEPQRPAIVVLRFGDRERLGKAGDRPAMRQALARVVYPCQVAGRATGRPSPPGGIILPGVIL